MLPLSVVWFSAEGEWPGSAATSSCTPRAAIPYKVSMNTTAHPAPQRALCSAATHSAIPTPTSQILLRLRAQILWVRFLKQIFQVLIKNHILLHEGGQAEVVLARCAPVTWGACSCGLETILRLWLLTFKLAELLKQNPLPTKAEEMFIHLEQLVKQAGSTGPYLCYHANIL